MCNAIGSMVFYQPKIVSVTQFNYWTLVGDCVAHLDAKTNANIGIVSGFYSALAIKWLFNRFVKEILKNND